MRQRTSEEWRADLAATGPRRDEALADLSAWVLRAARFYLCRQAPGRARLDPEQVEALAEELGAAPPDHTLGAHHVDPTCALVRRSSSPAEVASCVFPW